MNRILVFVVNAALLVGIWLVGTSTVLPDDVKALVGVMIGGAFVLYNMYVWNRRR